jgi:hypothetical protein
LLGTLTTRRDATSLASPPPFGPRSENFNASADPADYTRKYGIRENT